MRKEANGEGTMGIFGTINIFERADGRKHGDERRLRSKR